MDKAAEQVTQAIHHGMITPIEGDIPMNTLESRSRILEKTRPEDPIGGEPLQVSNAELAVLTDDELAQLIATTEKLEAARRTPAGRSPSGVA